MEDCSTDERLTAYQTRSPAVAKIANPTLSGTVVVSMLIMAIWHRGGSLRVRGLKLLPSCSKGGTSYSLIQTLLL